MSAGISFGPDRSWLVRTALAEPVLERVAQALAPADPGLAEFVEQGIYVQSVSVRLLDPPQRERVRRAVADVARRLLADDALLDALDDAVPGVADDDQRSARRRTVQQLLDLAESDETRRFAAGESG
jgi:hypothetical protein